ncbi:MAG: beta-ketoacyl-ACP reductase [Gammaproteobacteria bacterium RIFCSPHIGHO2_12_FULL_37_34]|nr:MAG: beta-ketoacyl-ACP reductase [Gammaproteobacteria bacterium RIFCSPHIGHO2_12_FULL_37_34]
MEKRVALVTGGMGGIGEAICRELFKQGMQTIATYNRGGNHKAAQAWQDNQKQAGYQFDIAYVDVSDFTSCESMINQILNKIGTIDILINNAGLARDHTCCKMSKEEWDIVINTDLNSVFYITHAVINQMKEKKFGRIINISSINGQKGQFGQVNYSAAKAGMHGFTKALALEVAKSGITVNTISPGYVDTKMIEALPEKFRNKLLEEIPIGRFATPEEIAYVVAFLASEKSNYITGANIAINGGHYMF